MIQTIEHEDLRVLELIHSSSPLKHKIKGSKGKESSIPSTRFTTMASAKLNYYGGQRGARAFFLSWLA